jgi:hypothetical protein
LAFSTKATNQYGSASCVAYLCNNFASAFLLDMLKIRGQDFDQDMWALSEMLQWIWRSRIRNGEHIHLLIPSSRMRKLFERWLDDEFVVSNPLSYRMASENLGIVFVDSPVANASVKEPFVDKNMPTTCWDGWEQDDGAIEASCVFDKQLPPEYASEHVDNEMPVISWEGFD